MNVSLDPNPTGPKWGISGYRYYTDWEGLCRVLNEQWLKTEKPSVIIHGNCIGADLMADRYAKCMGIPVEVYDPDFEAHGRRNAYLVRDRLIVDRCDLLIAFPSAEHSKGTIYTMNYVEEVGKPVIKTWI